MSNLFNTPFPYLLMMYSLADILGLMMWLAPPKYNYLFGFRTQHVMDHPEKWTFAQVLYGKWFVGLVNGFMLLQIADAAYFESKFEGPVILSFCASICIAAYWVHLKTLKYDPIKQSSN